MTTYRFQAPSEREKQSQFIRLFLSSERELFRYIGALVPNPDDAQEIVQQAAVALWEKFDNYDPRQPFTPWACRFALNVAKQWIGRRERWKALLDEHLAETLARRRAEMLPHMEARLRHLDECIRKLPEDQENLLRGYYFRQASVEALAHEAGRSVGAIYKSLQRIRRSLRDCIEKAMNTEAMPS